MCSDAHVVPVAEQFLGKEMVGGSIPPVGLVVHCKRDRYDVYIGRGSKWGNPFVIGRDGTREEVIRKYKNWIMTQPELMAAIPELAGKILGCWCAPLDCHGEVLVALVEYMR